MVAHELLTTYLINHVERIYNFFCASSIYKLFFFFCLNLFSAIYGISIRSICR